MYFLADTKEDLKEISAEMGVECFVIKEACEYKTMSNGEWVKQAQATGTTGEVDLTGYATEEYVDEKVANIEIPEVDLEPYAKKEEIPSVEGLASEKYVDDAIKIATHMDKDYGEAHMFGLMVDSTGGKTLIEAMYEKGKGMYNFHVEKGSPGLPDAVVEKNSSCRGICCVDTLKPTGWYGWIIMFDQDGDMYVQYIRNSEPKGWKEVVNKTEIEKANLKVGEDEKLEADRKIILNSEKINESLNIADLEMSDKAIDAINTAIRSLEKIEDLDELLKLQEFDKESFEKVKIY